MNSENYYPETAYKVNEMCDRHNLPPVQKILEDEDFREERQRLLAGDPLRRFLPFNDVPDVDTMSIEDRLDAESFSFEDSEEISEAPIFSEPNFQEISVGSPDKKIIAASIFTLGGTIILIHGEEAIKDVVIGEELEKTFPRDLAKYKIRKNPNHDKHQDNLKTLPERKRQRLLRGRTRKLLEKEGLKF